VGVLGSGVPFSTHGRLSLFLELPKLPLLLTFGPCSLLRWKHTRKPQKTSFSRTLSPPNYNPAAVLSLLKDLVQESDQRSSSDQRLGNWLNPTVNVLYTFSATIGGGIGLVILKLVI
jgi:hypothetical protein